MPWRAVLESQGDWEDRNLGILQVHAAQKLLSQFSAGPDVITTMEERLYVRRKHSGRRDGDGSLVGGHEFDVAIDVGLAQGICLAHWL